MADYGRYCPVSLASSVIGDRWTPLILREMVIGSTRFNDIARGLPGISRSLLVQRLKHLERYGVVERWPSPTGRGHEYHLTPAGKDLEPVILSLGRWAIHWLWHELEPHDVDPVTLTWWMHRRVDPTATPDSRV
ncbi:MAG: winged helix-turn-helix transcriptional regulator, partial [Actinomycetota bacterium]